ncbi:MAG: hypothetical protein ACYCZX_18000, partial [Rhodospirillaceae bacterium]
QVSFIPSSALATAIPSVSNAKLSVVCPGNGGLARLKRKALKREAGHFVAGWPSLRIRIRTH